MLDMYQRNHMSMYLKYDVFGTSLLMDPISDTRTRRIVTLIRLLFEISTGFRKRVIYAINHRRKVGKNVIVM